MTTTTIRHKHTGREMEIELFQESRYDWTTFMGGQWKTFSKSTWEEVGDYERYSVTIHFPQPYDPGIQASLLIDSEGEIVLALNSEYIPFTPATTMGTQSVWVNYDDPTQVSHAIDRRTSQSYQSPQEAFLAITHNA